MAGKNAVGIETIFSNLKNQIYYPVYLLHGEEPYYIDLISDYIEEHVLTETEKEFNQTIVYGKEVDIPTLISYAKRYPMMANYQVIVVKEAQVIKDLEEFIPYIQNPLSSTILVLCHKYEKIDARKSIAKAVEKTGILFESARLYENKIPGWIENHVRKSGYNISAKAACLLTEFLGNDLSRIVSDIGKLIISLPAGAEITEELIEKNIGISKDFNVFELQKALGYKQIFKANQIICYFAANPKENPMVKIIPILFAFFTKVLLYHYLPDKSRNSVAAALSVNPFFIPDYQQTAKNYPVQKLSSVISILHEYDLRSKGVNNASVTDGELMKEMIYKILH